MASISFTTLPEVAHGRIASFLKVDVDNTWCGIPIRRDENRRSLAVMSETSAWAMRTYLKYQERINLFAASAPGGDEDEEGKRRVEGAEEDMDEEEALLEKARVVVPSLLARRPGIKFMQIGDEVSGSQG